MPSEAGNGVSGNRTIINRLETKEHLHRLIAGSRGFFAGRIGGSDWDLAAYYYHRTRIREWQGGDVLQEFVFSHLLTKARHWNGYYDIELSPERSIAFCECLISFINGYDIASAGNARLLSLLGAISPDDSRFLEPDPAERERMEIFLKSAGNYDLFDYGYMEDLQGFLLEVFPLLQDKRVLVCTPFGESFMRQFSIREKLFERHPAGIFEYPRFDLQILPTPVTYEGCRSFPHSNWDETAEALCEDLRNREFDIALLGCGSYALPLGTAAKEMGRGAVYIGGVLQLYFGVKGRRYENDYYRQFMNEHWIRPLEIPDERVSGSDAPTEAWGAYW